MISIYGSSWLNERLTGLPDGGRLSITVTANLSDSLRAISVEDMYITDPSIWGISKFIS